MEYVKKETGLPYKCLCEAMRVPYANFKRWYRRKLREAPVISVPGPKKVPPFEPDLLKIDIACLDHGRKRTHGTGSLQKRYAQQISRRDMDELVQQARKEMHEVSPPVMIGPTHHRNPDPPDRFLCFVPCR